MPLPIVICGYRQRARNIFFSEDGTLGLQRIQENHDFGKGRHTMAATKTHGVKSPLLQNPSRPTFIGIGGHKCASTWLAECLYYHPEVLMTSPKEIQFFDRNVGKGMGWYLKHFRNGKEYKAAGEFTPRYLVNVPPTEIRDALGNLQVIVSLRNPVSRFISHYQQYIRRGLLSKQQVGCSSHPGLTTQLLCFQHLSSLPLVAKDGIVKKPSVNWP